MLCTGIISKKFQKFRYEKGIWRDNFPREILEHFLLSRLSTLLSFEWKLRVIFSMVFLDLTIGFM